MIYLFLLFEHQNVDTKLILDSTKKLNTTERDEVEISYLQFCTGCSVSLIATTLKLECMYL